MKISVISKSDRDYYCTELKKFAKGKAGVTFQFLRLDDYSAWSKKIKSLGEVVFWLSAPLANKFSARTAFLSRCRDAGKIVVNHGLVTNPNVIYKNFQQQNLSQSVRGIMTYGFSKKEALVQAIKRDQLRYPFIMKANYGCRGKGVSLIKDKQDLEKLPAKMDGFVFQNFISNNGDFRIFVLGGRPLWVAKRVAAVGGFLNNVAQGGTIELIKAGSERTKLCALAARVAAHYELNFCGVDIIRNQKTGEYHFMEINSLPSLDCFQPLFKEPLMKAVFDYLVMMGERQKKALPNLLKQYFEADLSALNDKEFHYLSRLSLWTGEKKYYKALEKFKVDLGGFISLKQPKNIDKNHFEAKKYEPLLFSWLMLRNLYGQDRRKELLSCLDFTAVKKEALKLMKSSVLLVEQATPATNVLYIMRGLGLLSSKMVNLDFFNRLAEKMYVQKNIAQTKKLIYLLTHAIIGESEFYYKAVKRNSQSRKTIALLEKMIWENCLKLSLDIKFEFLVCCRLTGIKTFLEGLINEEAELSLSQIGNYLVDKVNAGAKSKKFSAFSLSEHRNVLYLMSQLPYNKKNK